MATIVGTRSPLFYKAVKGGLPVILDTSKFTGNVFFVDSAAAGKGDTTGHGTTPDSPFATIDYAIGRCTANQGDVILVLPGHVETVTAAGGLDLDVAGITVIGLGHGSSRPTVNFTTVDTADADVDAANITIKNLLFTCGIDEQAIMLDVNADDCTVEDCEFRGSATAQPLAMIDNNGGAANAADRMTVRRCKFISYTAATAANEAIELGEVNDEILIEDNVIDGDWGNAGIHNPVGKILTNLRILRNVVRNRQTGDHAIELVSACTGEAVGNALFADTAAAIFDPGSLFTAGNKLGNAIDQESLDYIALFPAAAVPANGASLAAVLRDVWDAVRNGTGGTEPGANKSLVDALGFDGAAAVTASAGMLRTMTGTRFVVKKTLTSSAIVTAGVDITAVSTVGDILIEDIVCQTDATGLATGTNFEIRANNAKGAALVFSETVANMGANVTERFGTGSVATGTPFVLETGKKLTALSTVMDCTGGGTVDVYVHCRRLADNATLAAA